MHRLFFHLLPAVAVLLTAAPVALCAQTAKAPSAPVFPHYDPPDQPFRMAPMPQSTRSIVVPLATNLHLAFDTALLRTHTVWSGKGLALLGPQYGLPKSPFISTNDGTVLWTMPPVFPWAVGETPASMPEKLPAWARFTGINIDKSNVAAEYELTVDGRAVLVREYFVVRGSQTVARVLRVGPCAKELWFLAHAEWNATVSLTSKDEFLLTRPTGPLAVAVRAKENLKLKAERITSRQQVERVTEVGAEKGHQRSLVEGEQARVWVGIPPHTTELVVRVLSTAGSNKVPTEAEENALSRLLQPEVMVAKTFVATTPARAPTVGSAAFRAESFPLPKEIELSVCGMDFLPNGDLVVCTWPGEVFVIEKATGPTKAMRYRRFARGLAEPMGLAVRDGKIYVGTKQALYRLTDTDANGEADLFECLNQSWGYTGSYNAFVYGPVFDRAGNVILANAGHSGRWDSAYMGWALRISPDGKKLDAICSGLREPNGIGTFGPDRDVFVSENQGQWMAACKLNHVTPGKFYGHPSAWPAPQEDYGKHTRFDPPAVWFPYKLARSTTGLVEITDDRFGPFKGQLMVGDFQNAIVTRVQLEKVNGEYQGAVWPFLKQFQSGVNRLVYGPDGKLYVGGLQAPRSWSAVAPLNASLERIEFTGKLPFEVKEVHAQRDGFELTFTQPVEAKVTADPESYDVTQFGYKYQAKYGSPDYDHDGKENAATVIKVTGATVSPDKLKVRLKLEGWKTGYVTMVRSLDVKNAAGEPLVNDTFWYTLNQIPR
jgi:glucose/arabinose dehydrogenase